MHDHSVTILLSTVLFVVLILYLFRAERWRRNVTNDLKQLKADLREREWHKQVGDHDG